MVLPRFEDINIKSAKICTDFYETGEFAVKFKCRNNSNEFLLENFHKTGGKRLSFGTRTLAGEKIEIQNKWNSDNLMFTEMAFRDFFPNTRFGTTGSFSPSNGKLGAAGTFLYAQGPFRMDMSVFRQNDKTQVKSQFIFGVDQWIFGTELGGDPNQDRLTSTATSIAYYDPNFQVVASKRLENLSLTFYQKIAQGTEFVITCGFDGQKTKKELAIAQELADLKVLAKIDTKGSFWVGLQRSLNSGIVGKVFGQWDQKAKMFGKVGVGFEVSI